MQNEAPNAHSSQPGQITDGFELVVVQTQLPQIHERVNRLRGAAESNEHKLQLQVLLRSP